VLSGWLEAFAAAFGLVFVAEFGDKTQLLVLAFATRYRAVPVVIGVVGATVLVMAVSVAAGALLGQLVDTRLLSILAGIVFIGFAAWTLLDRDDDEAEEASGTAAGSAAAASTLRTALIVGTGFAVAEIGDKSMLATLTLATQANPLATWAGASLAMAGLSLVAVVVGRALATRISPPVVRLAGAAAFAVFGAVLIIDGLSAA
jgi:Ca2+/H+ antiporter, TMEM165/GDT1 family